MIRLDMSEYMEEHSVAKLIGSPPGYVGHEEEGQLTGKLRTKPYSVVLLDEIEKAHTRVFDMFLQVFDEGRLTDSKGRTADARNAIFIMTSNIPSDKHIGFNHQDTEESKTEVLREVEKRFRTEFINRIDEQIVFRPLGEEDASNILRPMLDDVCMNLKKKYGVTLQVGEEAKRFIAKAGHSPQYGVRELRRTVERLIQVPLSLMIQKGELKKHEYWQVVCVNNKISIIPKIKRDSEVIIEHYEDASKKLSPEERENLHKNIKTFVEKLEKASTDEEIVNIIKEIIFDIRKAQKKPQPPKPVKEPLEGIEDRLHGADFNSIKNILITSLKKKFR